ncbi:sigma-54-dependent transcriptional regulator [Pannonibacter indicus]|uniref:DNA-binding transcriptional response regulator, NtrC family, contains REC, AAA-type ATPase, and a Fis-type DNA-binding domains n=1 Tax=Pannonibacter indicus TaxID=466044 RepID=A0A0K6HNP5_9HYPH|nr:sigma-54 dependent transcriptional regulator [Pannonibacter indicus]CUA92504.1 DNA-binding transcriptional response regulator, NtrC family, contains REC, AAA-type ATPase, and a Fis-type DNA-binding domains [Pannonibacter indicus]
MTASRILVVEDDATLGASLRQRLELEGFKVRWARSASEARAALDGDAPDIILSDIRLPDGDGESLMRQHFARSGMVPVIFMTAYGDIDQAVRLVRDGALDYVSKPFDLDALVDTLQVIASRRSSPAGSTADPFSDSPAMEKTGSTLRRAAAVDLPVLLLGETGTGKEVAARYVHEAGPRKGKPFVPVNCGALPADLADSLLFGHERGAFTGAGAAHRGFFEEAEDGTLFLDEIGDLPPALQVKLLRVLETREFRRLGASQTRRFEARIVCATNKDLEAMATSGAFREDLWFRINVITCKLPPLRERQEEIPALLQRLATEAAARMGLGAPPLSEAAKEAARLHPWPGNFRELINRVERAVALGSGSALTEADLFPEGVSREQDAAAPQASAAAPETPLADVRDAAEKAHITAALARFQGSTTAAAASLGISRSTLWEKMRRLGISRDEEGG